jgi:hypothetical protein
MEPDGLWSLLAVAPLGAASQLAGSAGGVLGDLLLDAAQALDLLLETLRNLGVLAGHLDTVLADGVTSHR